MHEAYQFLTKKYITDQEKLKEKQGEADAQFAAQYSGPSGYEDFDIETDTHGNDEVFNNTTPAATKSAARVFKKGAAGTESGDRSGSISSSKDKTDISKQDGGGDGDNEKG